MQIYDIELREEEILQKQEASFKNTFFDEGQKVFAEIRRLTGDNILNFSKYVMLLTGMTRSKISLAKGKVNRATSELRRAELLWTNLHEECKRNPTDVSLKAYLDANSNKI